MLAYLVLIWGKSDQVGTVDHELIRFDSIAPAGMVGIVPAMLVHEALHMFQLRMAVVMFVAHNNAPVDKGADVLGNQQFQQHNDNQLDNQCNHLDLLIPEIRQRYFVDSPVVRIYLLYKIVPLDRK